MISFLKLIRYKNLIMVLLTMILTKYALIHSYFQNSYLSNLEFLTLALSVVFITAGGYIVNDIFDVETDKVNKPTKVFIDVTISKKNAWRSYFLISFSGLILGVYLTYIKSFIDYSFIFIFTILGLFVYSKFLKKVVLLGNFTISLFIGFVIYIVYLFDIKHIEHSQLTQKEINTSFILLEVWIIVISYVLFAFLTTFIREIIKDIEDVNGDLKIKAKTLPILCGRKRASKVAFFLSSVLFIFLIFVLKSMQDNYLFLGYGIVFLLLPLLYFLYKTWFSRNKKDYSELSNQMKIIMLFGILSMLLFKFI